MTISLTSTPPAGATFSSGVLDWTPASAEAGQAISFTLQASDGAGNTATQSWSVTPANASKAGYLVAADLAASTINVHLSAIRRLATEAAEAGLLAPEIATAMLQRTRFPGDAELRRLAYWSLIGKVGYAVHRITHLMPSRFLCGDRLSRIIVASFRFPFPTRLTRTQRACVGQPWPPFQCAQWLSQFIILFSIPGRLIEPRVDGATALNRQDEIFATVNRCIREVARQAAEGGLSAPVIQRFLRTGERAWAGAGSGQFTPAQFKEDEDYSRAVKTGAAGPVPSTR